MSCIHQYAPSAHTDYQVCSLCGTYHSLASESPETLYQRGDYWSDKWGHSSITDQVFNCDTFVPPFGKLTKNEFVREHLNPPDFDTVIELGCAPGTLLKQLGDIFRTVVGIDADPHYKDDIRRIAGDNAILQFGLFPACTRKAWGKGDGVVSCIIGLDIFEHSPQPQAFLAECNRLLEPCGQLFLMLPMASEDLPERLFEPREHVYIHSKEHMQQLLKATGFKDTDFDRWTPGHETVSAWKT